MSHLSITDVASSWQGRRWPDVESRFEQMWSMTLRALDDIKVPICLVLCGCGRTAGRNCSCATCLMPTCALLLFQLSVPSLCCQGFLVGRSVASCCRLPLLCKLPAPSCPAGYRPLRIRTEAPFNPKDASSVAQRRAETFCKEAASVRCLPLTLPSRMPAESQ